MKAGTHTFESDIDKRRTPNLGELLPPDPKPHNLHSQGEPYYAGGFRIISECSGFRGLERWHPGGTIEIERSHQIEAAFWRSVCGVNDSHASSDPNRRVAFALALRQLMDYAERRRQQLSPLRDKLMISTDDAFSTDGGLGGHVRLGATLGLAISEAINADDPSLAIRDLTNTFKVGLENVAKAEGKKPDKRRRKGPKPHQAIHEAEYLFGSLLRSSASPVKLSKSMIQAVLVSTGFDWLSKDRRGKWADLFQQACLDDLPD